MEEEAEALLQSVDREVKPSVVGVTWGVLFEEVKRLGSLAAPMVVVAASEDLLLLMSTTMVGHLGKFDLSSTSIAISFCNATGFHLLWGMASALETLSGQAYGAKQYQKLIIQMYAGIFCLILVCLPVTLLWTNMENLLLLAGQDPLISREAGRFARWLLPGLFSYAVLQPLVRYFQTQSLMTPLLIGSCTTLCFHFLLCWVLVFKSGLSNLGGALTVSMSISLNVIFVGLYMKFSSCSNTRVRISKEIFRRFGEFFHLSLPSAAMVCLEFWSFELLIFLSGLLPNPALETSVLSSCVQTLTTLYAIPNGIASAASTRASNALGEGKPEAARIAVFAAVTLAIAEALIVSGALFGTRHVFGYLFSNEKAVVDYVAAVGPLVCLSIILDSLQGVLSGIMRGCGRQHVGAYINLGSFYLWGIPVGVTLAFWMKLRGVGLWIGILAGSFMQTLLLSAVTSCMSWNEQVVKARERLFEGDVLIEEEVCRSSV